MLRRGLLPARFAQGTLGTSRYNPISMRRARCCSCMLVSSGTRPISRKYMRTGSSSIETGKSLLPPLHLLVTARARRGCGNAVSKTRTPIPPR